MSSSNNDQLQLRLYAEDQATEIWIYDGQFRVVAYGLGRLDQRLVPGIYKVRATAGTATWDKVVVLEGKDVEVVIPALEFASPAPLPGTSMGYDHHQAAAEAESCRIHVQAGSGSAIFIFVRRGIGPGVSATPLLSRKHPAIGLTLHHLDGRLMADPSAQSATYTSPELEEWASFTVALDPGPYRLRLVLPDDSVLEQVLIAAKGWMTQVFALQRPYGLEPGDERADLPDATILYRALEQATGQELSFRQLPYEDQVKSQRLLELARQGLMNRRDVLPREVTEILWEKHDNPMLGIYGAHLLLLGDEPNWNTFRIVIDNLRRILGPHPDVEALALQRGETADPSYRFEVPPMLRRSWALVQQATFSQPELVPTGSLASQVSDRLWGGSLWHLWREPSIPILPLSEEEVLTVPEREGIPQGPPVSRAPVMDGYDVAITSQLRQMQEPDAPAFPEPEFEGRMMHDLAATRPQLDDATMQRLMEAVGLPRAKVEERVDRLYEKAQIYQSKRSEMPPGPDRTWQLESVVSDVRQTVRKGDAAPDVGQYIDEGSDGSRITALGILQVRPDSQFFPFVKGAIEASRTAFEQYQALLAAQAMLSFLSGEQKRDLQHVLEDQRSGGEGKHIRPGTDRWVVSSRILADLERR